MKPLHLTLMIVAVISVHVGSQCLNPKISSKFKGGRR